MLSHYGFILAPPSRCQCKWLHPKRVLGIHKKMHLPSASELCDLIRKAGRGCFLFATDMARAYRQFPLHPRDRPLLCFIFEGWFFVDISLPFGLRWVASHCQDAINLVSREFWRRGLSLLNYIDDLGGVASSKLEGESHFAHLQDLLETLGLQETCHKAFTLPRSWCG